MMKLVLPMFVFVQVGERTGFEFSATLSKYYISISIVQPFFYFQLVLVLVTPIVPMHSL